MRVRPSAFHFAPVALLTLVLSVGGCATSGQGGHGEGGHLLSDGRNPGWPLAELAVLSGTRILLVAERMPVGMVDLGAVRAAWGSASRLLPLVAGKTPEVLVIPGRPANAFATVQAGQPLVAVNFGMLELLGEDADAWAALVGHELAHLELNHQAQRQKRREDEESSSELIGLALTLVGVPFGSTLADASTALVERGYSRDDEREADRIGVEMMVRAGFDPAGAVRMQDRLARIGGSGSLPFLSTHPGGAERVEAMRELVKRYAPETEKAK